MAFIVAKGSTIYPALVAASPVIGIAVASIEAVGIALFCAYKIWEHRAGIKKGAENTLVKVKDGAVYSKNKAKESYEYSANSLKKALVHSEKK
ncbi:MAG: hypothetical protein PV340_05085 [Wolbachia sp.]|nr:hypothetical protein [Wolbachia sp.]MDD9335987.1 hypothetical protein [Wolbachia sp.]